MKVLKLLFKIFASLFVLYGIVGIFILPNIIKKQIQENANNILERKVELESVSINPYSFDLSIYGLVIKSKNGKDDFVGVRELSINIDPFNLIVGEVKIKFIQITSPFVNIHKDKNGTFNFSDLLVSKEETAGQDQEKNSKLPKIVLDSFAIERGKVNFTDETGSKVFSQTLAPINFTIRDLSTKNDHDNQISLHIDISDGGYIDYRGKIKSVEPLRLEGGMQLHSGRLYTQWQYFQDMLGIIVADGALDASFDYTADLSTEPMKIDINKYQFKIEHLRLQDKKTKENVLQLPSLALSGNADITNTKLNVQAFDIKGLSVSALRDEQGKINWTSYFPSSEASEDENTTKEKSPWKINIEHIGIGTESVSFEDHYAKRAYLTGFKRLDMSLKDIAIDADSVNLPRYALEIKDIYLNELMQNDLKTISLSSFSLNGNLSKAKTIDVNLESINLDGLDIYALMDENGTLNFTNLSAKEEPEKIKTESTQDQELNWKINSIILSNSRVDFRDKFNAEDAITTIAPINLQVDSLSSEKGSWANSELSMYINKTGKLSLSSKIRQSPLKINSQFKLNDLDLKNFQPYVNKKANADINSGSFNLEFKAEHDEATTKIVANTQINDLNISERKEGKTFFAFSKLLIKDIDLSLKPDHLKISEVNIYKPYARMKIDKNRSSNLDNLMISEANSSRQEENAIETSSDPKPFPVFIGKVNFKNGTGRFSDLSLPLPFKTDIHDLNGQMLGLGTLKDIKTTADIDGVVDEYGLMKIEGSLLSANPKKFTGISVKFQNIDMTNLSPYTGKFIGYELAEGKMNVELEYKINDSQMLGGNRIILKKLMLGKEVESEDAISAPVSLAIALLKDENGVIDLDVPVEGDVDAPEFAIGHVVWTAFKNLITGVATAPFRFLGNMLGVSAEELENVAFIEGKSNLLPPEREKLDKLSTALISKDMLIVKVAGTFDAERDLLAIKTAKLYDEALSLMDDKKTDISKMESDALYSLLKKMYIIHFNEERLDLAKKTVDKLDISSEAKKLLLRNQMRDDLIQDQKVSEKDLVELANTRAQTIVSYLISRGISAERLSVLVPVSIQADKKENEYISTKLELGAK